MNAPTKRVAGLGTDLLTAIRAAEYMPSGFSYYPVKLTVKDGPNVQFSGANVSGYSQNNERPRWEELILFAVEGGGFVAARGWHSNLEGEETFWTAREVSTVRDCMEVWGWTPVAKGFAKKLKWDVTAYIGERA